MYAICGWMGQLASAQASDQILDGMLAAAVPPGAPAAAVPPGRIRAMAGHAGAGAGAGLVYVDAEVLVCMSEPVAGVSGGVASRALDAAAIARLYHAEGDALLGHIHGSFALAVMDLRRHKILLAVDRAGIRPLYVCRLGSCVAFASRLGALRALPGFPARIADQALFDYLYCHMVPSPGSIYQGVEKLLPAQAVDLDPSGRHIFFYWHMPYRDDNPTPLADLTREFRRLLPQVVTDAAEADGGPGVAAEAIGCFLSGGTDSSTVAGTLRQLRATPMPTYSMGFKAKGYDEIGYARTSARHFGTTPRELYVEPGEVLQALPLIAAWTDEPFANASIVPAFLGARQARADGSTRLLAGDGGDEIFAGNARYADQQVFEVYRRRSGWLRRGLIDPLAALPGLGRVPVLRKFKSYVQQARIPLPDRLDHYNFLHRSPIASIFEPDFLTRIDPLAPMRAQRRVYAHTRSPAIVNRMMHLDLKITLADNDLRKVNLACELAGIDVRYPLLDERLMEFAAAVPPQLQLKDNQLRWFFKQALADFLPAATIKKRKQGFGTPVGVWMVEYPPLAEQVDADLKALGARGIVRADYIAWLRRRHAGEHAGYYGVMLWVLVMLEQWLRAHGH